MTDFTQDTILSLFTDCSITPENVLEIWNQSNGNLDKFRNLIPDDVKVKFNNWIVSMLNSKGISLIVHTTQLAFELRSNGSFDRKGYGANFNRKPGKTTIEQYAKIITPTPQNPQKPNIPTFNRGSANNFSGLARRTGARY